MVAMLKIAAAAANETFFDQVYTICCRANNGGNTKIHVEAAKNAATLSFYSLM